MNLEYQAKQKERTRKKILRKANALFLKNGIEATTIAAIASACDITRATVYAHYPDKRMLVVSSLYINLDKLYQFDTGEHTFNLSPRDSINKMCKLYLDSFLAHPEIMKFLVEYYRVYSEHDDEERLFAELKASNETLEHVKGFIRMLDQADSFETRMSNFYTVFNFIIGLSMRYALRKDHFVGYVERSNVTNLYHAIDKLVELI